MNFSLAEEQQLLREALARFIEKEYSFERRRSAVESAAGWSVDAWRALAELGVAGILVPQALGGYGGTMVDAAIVMETLGEGLLVEPFAATAILGATALVSGASAAQQAQLLPAVLRGDTILAWAHGEDGADGERAGTHPSLTTSAERRGDGYVLNGRKTLVLHGAQADILLVSAAVRGGQGTGEAAIFQVPGNAPGLLRQDRRTWDGLRAAELVLHDVAVSATARLAGAADVLAVIEEIDDRGAAAACAEAVGVMHRLQQLTLDYIKTRQQFGQPIGRFQVLQHRAADMYMAVEQSRSMAYFAALEAAGGDRLRRRSAVSAAKAYIGRTGRWVAQAALQMHGGIGLTDELPASHYAKRLTTLDFWYGSREEHLQRFIALQNGRSLAPGE